MSILPPRESTLTSDALPPPHSYGHSEGSPSEKGIKLDAQTALDFVLSHKELERTPIFLYGQSIGGAVAIFLASQNAQRVSRFGAMLCFSSPERQISPCFFLSRAGPRAHHRKHLPLTREDSLLLLPVVSFTRPTLTYPILTAATRPANPALPRAFRPVSLAPDLALGRSDRQAAVRVPSPVPRGLKGRTGRAFADERFVGEVRQQGQGVAGIPTWHAQCVLFISVFQPLLISVADCVSLQTIRVSSRTTLRTSRLSSRNKPASPTSTSRPNPPRRPNLIQLPLRTRATLTLLLLPRRSSQARTRRPRFRPRPVRR